MFCAMLNVRNACVIMTLKAVAIRLFCFNRNFKCRGDDNFHFRFRIQHVQSCLETSNRILTKHVFENLIEITQTFPPSRRNLNEKDCF